MNNSIFSRRFNAIIAGVLSVSLSVTGCSGFIGAQNNRNQAQYEETLKRQSAIDPARPVVSKTNNAYLAGEKISVAEQLSPILKKRVVYKPSRSVLLPDVAHWITEEFNLSVDLIGLQVNTTQNMGLSMPSGPMPGAVGDQQKNGSSVSFNGGSLPAPLAGTGQASMPMNTTMGMGTTRSPLQVPITINYTGTLNGLLDLLAQKAGVWWKFSDGKAVFYRSETKTFYLPTIARSFEGKSTITTNSTSGSGASTGSSSGAMGGASGGSSSSSGADSTAHYDVNLWKDIESTAKVVAGQAKVAVNAAAGSITITGSPADVRHMEEWVKSMSDQLSQQIQIDIDIYTVAVNNEENYSWNPSVIFKSATGNWAFNMNGVSAPAVLGSATPFSIGAAVINSSNYAGSTAAFNALSTIGKVTQKLHQQAIAMNGQPTPMQDASQQSYLAQSGTTQSANAGTTTTLTPGSFTVGFTALFVPKIINGKIVLGMTMTNSVLKSLNTITSGSLLNQSSIQTPNIDTTTIQNTVTLTPGDALLLTSLTKENGSNQNNGIFSPFFYLFGGGFDSASEKRIVAIVVTAKVL